MKVTLRSKALANGNRSLFLEFYDKGKRTYEFLHLYLIPEVDEKAKKENENALKKAHAIKAERIINPSTIKNETDKEKDRAIIEKEKKNKLTLMEWVDEYIDIVRNCGNYSNAAINQSITVKEALVQYLSHICRPGILLSKIDKEFVKGFLLFLDNGYVQKHWKKVVKPISESTKKVYQTKFNTIINRAVREGKMKENPFYQLDKHEIYHTSKVEREFLTIDEVKKFMEVETDGKETQRAFVFACFTGLRISDIRNLKWSDIKNPDIAPTIVIEQGKTEVIVRVPLGRMALSLLPKERRGVKVFQLPTATAVHTSCKWIAERAGIKKNVSFHTARHTFATLTLSACDDIELVSKLLGHKSVKTTQRYAEVLIETKKHAISKIDKTFI